MRNNNRVIPIWSSTTIEELNEWISAIEEAGYNWEFVHGRSGLHCLRYWDKTGSYTKEVI